MNIPSISVNGKTWYPPQYEVKEFRWRDDQHPDAKRLRDKMARQLRKEGWDVTIETLDFSDLGRFKGYGLVAVRRKEG